MDVVVDACAALAPRTHEPDYRAFGAELDEVKRRALARVGPEDVAYVKRLNRFSRAMEVIGRVLIHVSPEPVTFSLGVGALWLHKQLQATEIGHTALHGAYDRLDGAERFRSQHVPLGHARSTRSRGATATTSGTTATRTSPARTRTSTSAPCASPSRRRTRRGSAFQLRVHGGRPRAELRVPDEPALHRPHRRLLRQRRSSRSSTSFPTAPAPARCSRWKRSLRK